MVALRDLAPDERPKMGQAINALKTEFSLLCEQALKSFSQNEVARRLEEEKLDISLPGRHAFMGRCHPIRQMMDEMIAIFAEMGFTVQYGPEIDSDYYNFEGLNFPKDHPARDMQDTFYVAPDQLLRTHTTNVQLRVMESHRPPIRVIAPGTVYRNENVSARSHVFFQQIDGLYIDKEVTFSDLFATMNTFCAKLFNRAVETRFRPSFFPFVEPGLELDLKCTACDGDGDGCRLCKQTGWLEILGAGMVHPTVLRNGGVDPEHYNGFAWGLGVERLALLRYGIPDIRLLSENDLRFLEQFISK
jgi:phenylalanyl-tRNA synthetase alpha chain